MSKSIIHACSRKKYYHFPEQARENAHKRNQVFYKCKWCNGYHCASK